MQRSVNQIMARSFVSLWLMLVAVGTLAVLILGHPMVLRFTPGPAGGGIPPGFFAGLATPALGAILAQGVLALAAGMVWWRIVPPSWRILRRSVCRTALAV